LADTRELAGAPGWRTRAVSLEEWARATQDLAANGARLAAMWASRGERVAPTVHAAFFVDSAALLLSLRLADADAPYPGLEGPYPSAARMQRAIADLSGLRSSDPDTRPWLRHNAWAAAYRPLIDPPSLAGAGGAGVDAYEFVRVDGEGVHEIPVGPVHAGVIEPGHFRFSAVGEKVLRLEERLGYVHKGIERRFTELPILEAHRLAARVSGDSAVAFSWAFCQALEGIARVEIPPRAAWLRALYLEIERVTNHLGDLGALGNDAGFAFRLMQFSRLKELRECVGAIGKESAVLRTVYDEHQGVRDRFTGAGAVAPNLAARLGLMGLAGRASGQAFDLRVDLPCAPYAELSVRKSVRSAGDVAARAAVRFDELAESLRLIERLTAGIPEGPHLEVVPRPVEGTVGIGAVEGWRGPVLVALEAGPDGTIRRCHPHDPSWQNWPVLEHAIIGNIVPDFPLINKSFNLSYSGHDL